MKELEEIEDKITNEFYGLCDRFMQEEIGSAELNLMPPKDKVPEIYKVDYEKDNDTFEIHFIENNNCDISYNKSGAEINFSKDEKERLTAMRINNFSKIGDESKMASANETIEKEMEQLSQNIKEEQNILDNVIDKRKLIFLKYLLTQYYAELINAYVRNASSENNL